MAANYSTVARVRMEAGFSANARIIDTTIQTYMDQATGIINGVVSRRYNLGAMLSAANFSSTQANTVLARVEELLAAGHILNKDYDIQDQEQSKKGDVKINDAYKILNDIESGVIQLTDLRYDANGAAIANTGVLFPTLGSGPAGVPVAYPTDDTNRVFSRNTQR